MAILGFNPPKGWGTREQIDAAIGHLEDLTSQGGNNDRLIGNERLEKDQVGGRYAGNTVMVKARAFAGPGLSTNDEVSRLTKFLAAKEAQWGTKVTSLDLSGRSDGMLWAARKAIELERIGRTPQDVGEKFITASGSVAGREIADRRIFTQHFKPTAPATGKVVVVSPGFKETSENFHEQIAKMNALGHDAIVMDHQWAGMSSGKPGGMDSLFGAARDVAAVCAHAARVMKSQYGDRAGAEVMLFGNSMGGAAAFAAATMADNGKISLRSDDLKTDRGAYAQMPKGVRMVLQAPFFGATPNAFNKTATFAAEKPFLNPITTAPIADTGMPFLSGSKIVQQKNNQGAVDSDVRAQLKTIAAANADLATVLKMVQDGVGPSGEVHIVHGANDTLAHHEMSAWVAGQLGPRAELRTAQTKNHVLEQDPELQGFAIDGLKRLVDNKLSTDPLPKQAVERKAASWFERLGALLQKAASPIGWLLAKPPPHTDVTQDFKVLQAQINTGKNPLPAEAKQHKYLLIPGLFTEHYPGYMKDNLRGLRSAGLQANLVNIDTDASVAVNAKAIRDAIMDATKDGSKVVLVGHSKGGVDFSAALAMYPELKGRVRAAVAMQAPYGGTPIATDIVGCPDLRPLVDGFIQRAFSGDPKSLEDLSYEARQAFVGKHSYPTDIPTVCLATSSSNPLSLTAAAAGYVKERYGEGCDGLVPLKDAIIPGSRVVKLDDLDHAGPAMAGPSCLTTYDPATLTVAMVALALKS